MGSILRPPVVCLAPSDDMIFQLYDEVEVARARGYLILAPRLGYDAFLCRKLLFPSTLVSGLAHHLFGGE